MTSKRLFVDLCDENRKRRLWPIALSITGNFFAQIVFAFILMSNCEDRLKWDIGVTWAELQSGFFVNVSGLGSIPILLIVFGLALINALNGFGYLFDSRLSDLYGALPVRREKQFDAVCFNGIVIFVIPFVVCHIFTIVVATAKGFVTISSLPLYVLCMLITIILYVLAYMVYVLAAIMTGHVVVAALASGVFTLIGPAVYYGIQIYEETFFISYMNKGDADFAYFLSPFWVYFKCASTVISNSKIEYPVEIIPYVLYAIIVSIVLFVFCRYLIKKRPSEAAGKAIAFNITKPYIKIAISIVVSMYFGFLFYEFGNKVGGYLFGIISGLILSHAVIETIFEFDFKASAKHLDTFGISAAIMAVLSIIFIFDPLHYDSWLPNDDKVESYSFSDNIVYSDIVYVDDDDINVCKSDYQYENMKLTDIGMAEVIERAGAQYAADYRIARIFGSNDPVNTDEYENYRSVTFKWNLKNGKTVSRNFYINIADEEIKDCFGKIYDTEEYKKGTFAILNQNLEKADSIAWSDLAGEHTEKLTAEELSELQKIIAKDILNQSFEELKNEDAIMNFSFNANTEYDYNRKIASFYLFPSYKETIEYLNNKGITTDYDSSKAYVDKINLTIIGMNDEGYWESSNAEEIKKVLDNVEITDLSYVNSDVRDRRDDERKEVVYLDTRGAYSVSALIDLDSELPSSLRKEIDRVCPNSDESASVRTGSVGWVKCLENG